MTFNVTFSSFLKFELQMFLSLFQPGILHRVRKIPSWGNYPFPVKKLL